MQRPALARRLTQAGDVEPLEVAQAAVDRLQAVPGGAAAEVVRLQQGHAESARGRFPGRGRAVDAAPDDHDVMRTAAQGVEVAAEHGADDSTGPRGGGESPAASSGGAPPCGRVRERSPPLAP